MVERRELKPNPGAQDAFLSSQADEVLYGGAAGGGKSLALIIWALHEIENPGYRCLLLRRTYPELRNSLIDESWNWYPHLRGQPGTYNEQRHTWTFPSGAKIVFGSCQYERDVHQFQSAAFARIGFDQLETFTRGQYTFLLARLRNVHGIPNQMRATANPGGVGGAWIKKYWIDKLAPNEIKHYLDEREVEAGTALAMSRQFIPARVYDNPALMENDPMYVARLHALPARLRLMYLEGRWDVAYEGLVYGGYDTTVHLIDPQPIPESWRRFRSVDFGYTNPFVCQWWAVSPDDELHLYREIYETERLVSELGPQINELSRMTVMRQGKEVEVAEKFAATVADHDAENRAELNKHGISTVPARKAIREGVQEVEVRLMRRHNGKPRIYIHRGCTISEDPRLAHAGRPQSTAEEFAVYQYPEDAEGHAVKEEPVDVDNHGMDGVRYITMHLKYEQLSRARSRSAPGV